MENKPATHFPCPHHTSQIIQKIDPKPNTDKDVYCCDCIFEDRDPKSLFNRLLTLDNFLSNAAIFYSANKHKIGRISDVPDEYIGILSQQAHHLENLVKHLDEEKKKIESIFEEITKLTIERITQKKNEYIQMIDLQVSNVSNWYAFVEKELKRAYPKVEDVAFLFPTKVDLEAKLAKITSLCQLNDFIKGIKDDMNQNNEHEFSSFDNQDEVKKYLDKLVKQLKEVETSKPIYEVANLNLKDLANATSVNLNRSLQNALTLKNPISSHSAVSIDSAIIGLEHTKQIKDWMPNQNEFTMRLLYRSSRDGVTAEAFHAKSDDQGPTITLIKCQFQGSSKTSVIGGFIDQSWHQQNKNISSENAFIFSITKRVKCPVTYAVSAAYGYKNQGPSFGDGNDLVAFRESDPDVCYVKPNVSYKSNENIVESENYGGNGKIRFVPIEIEVFAIKQL